VVVVGASVVIGASVVAGFVVVVVTGASVVAGFVAAVTGTDVADGFFVVLTVDFTVALTVVETEEGPPLFVVPADVPVEEIAAEVSAVSLIDEAVALPDVDAEISVTGSDGVVPVYTKVVCPPAVVVFVLFIAPVHAVSQTVKHIKTMLILFIAPPE